MPRKTIFTGFSPNIDIKSVWQACAFLFLSWKWGGWRKGKNPVKVERWMENYFESKHAMTFDSGRSALFYALKALGVGEGDEVLVQAYTCVVVVNAIRWTGAVPIYVDVGEDLNIDPGDVQKKISPRAKVLIVQHTFGQPAPMNDLLPLAERSNMQVIEDCAHSLGARFSGKRLGTFGTIGMFSFGSDKVVSCVRGGALITNDDSIQQKIESYRGRMPQTDRLLVFQHLMHYPLFFVGRALYHVKIGKWILAFAKRLHIMNRIIYRPEKEGKQLPFYPRLLPNALALILQRQLSELEQLNAHRKAIAAVYDDVLEKKIERQRNDAESIHLRYTLFLDDAKTCRAEAKKQGILLGDWYDTVIAPRDIRMEATGYKKGDCPWAESYAKKSLNLPTSRHISERDAKRIASFVNNFFTSHNK